MWPDPAVGYEWMSVDQFVAQVAARPRQVFPVVDRDGRPTGAVTLRALSESRPQLAGSTRLAEVQVPLAVLPAVGPLEPLAGLAMRLAPSPDGLALVIDGVELVGVVTTADAARALHLAEIAGGRNPSTS